MLSFNDLMDFFNIQMLIHLAFTQLKNMRNRFSFMFFQMADWLPLLISFLKNFFSLFI